jgi:hypothetical protein
MGREGRALAANDSGDSRNVSHCRLQSLRTKKCAQGVNRGRDWVKGGEAGCRLLTLSAVLFYLSNKMLKDTQRIQAFLAMHQWLSQPEATG